MEILYVLIPLALAIAGLACLAFIWGVQKGQFEDLETPAQDILIDE